MSVSLPAIAADVVRSWVRLYTVALPVGTDRRRAEIDSDLWEQQRDAVEAGHKSWVTATEK